MNFEETSAIIAKAKHVDNRHVDAGMVLAWNEILGDLSYEDANRALIVFRRERPGVYLEPGHLLEISATWRADRKRRERAELAQNPQRLAQLSLELSNRVDQQRRERERDRE